MQRAPQQERYFERVTFGRPDCAAPGTGDGRRRMPAGVAHFAVGNVIYRFPDN
jgi:hypothetical protein